MLSQRFITAELFYKIRYVLLQTYSHVEGHNDLHTLNKLHTISDRSYSHGMMYINVMTKRAHLLSAAVKWPLIH